MIRIIAGSAKGRKLNAPAPKDNDRIRPTLGRVREAIFSILSPHLANSKVCDLYAGTGALGIEALSRGAENCIFVDHDKDAIKLIDSNIALTGFHDRAQVLTIGLPNDLEKVIDKTKDLGSMDIVFCDPPYQNDVQLVLETLGANNWLRPDGFCLLQCKKGLDLADRCGNLALVKKKTYGKTTIYLYKRKVD